LTTITFSAVLVGNVVGASRFSIETGHSMPISTGNIYLSIPLFGVRTSKVSWTPGMLALKLDLSATICMTGAWWYCLMQTKPNQTKPNQTKLNG
jgi:hypothetical protein